MELHSLYEDYVKSSIQSEDEDFYETPSHKKSEHAKSVWFSVRFFFSIFILNLFSLPDSKGNDSEKNAFFASKLISNFRKPHKKLKDHQIHY